MGRDRAAYMREYRARLKRTAAPVEGPASWDELAEIMGGRIVELEAEVARLKRELAARPATFNSRPFTPVPKR